MKNLNILLLCIYLFSCTKPEKNAVDLLATSDSTAIQVQYLKKIKTDLKDSVVSSDYDLIDFSKAYRSSDVEKKHFYLRVGFIDKEISKDFILLFTDSAGNILRGRIVNVNKEKSNDSTFPNYSFKLSTLNRRKVQYLVNKRTHSNVDQMLADDDQVVGEQILPTVVVTAHIFTYGEFYTLSDLFLYDALSGDDNFGGGGGGPNGNT